LEGRLNEAERTLAASQADLNQARHHALLLEDQKAELKRVADARSLEVQEANKRWELVEKKMEDLAQGFSNATSTRDAPTLPNEDATDPEIVDRLRTELGLLQEEVEILTARNSELEDLSLSVVERYGSGELASPLYYGCEALTKLSSDRTGGESGEAGREVDHACQPKGPCSESERSQASEGFESH